MGPGQKNDNEVRFLPLTRTAEMTLSHLADTGDADALALFRELGLNGEQIIDSPATILSPEYRLTRTVFLHARRLAADALAELTKASLFVDLPCGFSPRGLRCAREGVPWLGVDLPPVIGRIEPAVRSLTDAEQRSFIRYAAADATNPDALLTAVKHASGNGELCIITEGLLMYLSAEETGLFCEGIRRILSLCGGCWITADPEMPLHMFLILKAICGERFSEVAEKGFLRKPVSGRQLPVRPPVSSPLQIEIRPDIRSQIEMAKDFLSGFGLKAERIPISVLLPETILPEKLSGPRSEAVRDALQMASCWVITLCDQK